MSGEFYSLDWTVGPSHQSTCDRPVAALIEATFYMVINFLPRPNTFR